MNKAVPHEMIMASAGSGKTYALVNRFLRLLALGVPPARIIALTFTRKAAGEFLQNIFLRLTGAAADPAAARRLSGELGIEPREPAWFRGLLADLVHGMGSLQLSTIDSFFGRVVGAFPYELGLIRPHRVMEAFEENLARQDAMEQLLAYSGEQRTEEILQLYKQLTWGAEEKRVYSLFEDSLRDCHALFLESNDPRRWGAAELIFDRQPWWHAHPAPDKDALVAAMRGALPGMELKKQACAAFEKLIDAFEAWTPGQKLEGGALFDRLMETRRDLQAGHATVLFSRAEIGIGPPVSGHLYQLLQAYMRGEIARRLVMTQSLGRLLADFDRLYAALVRQTGMLVFADLPMLLIRGLAGGERAFGAADLAYRLDGQADHWLIDEFQDTSRIQWKVLGAFVEEVLQDPGGQRSYFHVGDTKQSIYGWRGGDSRISDEILAAYGDGGRGILQSELHVSWRSAPPVLDCVNALFGAPFADGLLPAAVCQRWGREWNDHRASPVTAGRPGHAAWGLVQDEASLTDGCVDLLRELDPVGRGLSCAILLRRNPEVAEVTQALRAAGIPASMEGVVHIAMDNLPGAWLRALFRALARPDENFPRAFLRFPVPGLKEGRIGALIGRMRATLAADGYAAATRHALGFIAGEISMDDFLTRRAEQLLEAATRFEGSGVASLEGFVGYLEAATVEESTLRGQVQVMTVHKAKGLTFDMTVVAGFGDTPMFRRDNNPFHAERAANGDIQWILNLPNKDVLEQEPRLRAARAAEEEKAAYEALCLLYVAMTRPRYGLYCLSLPPKVNRSQAIWHQLFAHAFGCGDEPRRSGSIEWQREWGQPGWMAELPRETPAPAPRVRLAALSGPLPPIRPILRRAAAPSVEAHAGERPQRQLASPEGRRFGTVVHDFLATIEWIEFDDPGAPAGVPAVLAAAPERLRGRLEGLLAGPLARAVFGRPDGGCRLWREKPYLLRKRDTLAGGIIDRAILYTDTAGKPLRAVIYDFKTDALDPARPAQEQLLEKYQLQLERYREALGILAGLPSERVEATLVPV